MEKSFGSFDSSIRAGSSDTHNSTASDCVTSNSSAGDMTQVQRDTFVTTETLEQRLGQALDRKEYIHWETPEEREQNRLVIENYDEKKRAVDRASLLTQRDTINRYRDCFDAESIHRMHSELGSNKTEIYNEPSFSVEKAPHRDGDGYRVVGMRDVRDGKICIRDNASLDSLKHTSSHETMHDLSYQNASQDVYHTRNADGEIITISRATNCSGIFCLEMVRTVRADGVDIVSEIGTNRSLNEGMTEMYTIEAMQSRGETPRFDSYTQEVAWAMQLREIVGEDTFARAYFAGDVGSLEQKVNNMSNIDDAWNVLNRMIDAYHDSISHDRPAGDVQLKKTVDAMIDDLFGSREYGSRRMR